MTASPAASDDRTYRKTINAWAMYDWGNSAFSTTIMAAIFPPFYRSLVTGSGLSETAATSYWAYTASMALFIVALLGPALGAIADYTGGRKYYIGFFAGLGVIGTGLFAFLGDDTYVWASVLFIIGNVGFAGGNIFYESLLPHIARQEDIDQVSTRGYALGYVGGGILLVVNLLWVMHPEWFWMPGVGFALRASFFSVAVWWAIFAIPNGAPGCPEFACCTISTARKRMVFAQSSSNSELLIFSPALLDILRHSFLALNRV